MKNTSIYLLLAGILLYGCSKNEIPSSSGGQSNETTSGWLVPLDNLVISLLPADRIQSIDTPHFETISNENISNNETVYVYRWENMVKVYTESILGGHEIVNDQIDDHYFAITYCPLTGSALAWNREINGEVTEFGVSGHLYNENLIPYDRNSLSFWSQMMLQSIKGNMGGDVLESEMLLATIGRTVKSAFPDALVLVDTSGHVCNDSICISSNHGYDETSSGNNNRDISSTDLFGIINVGVVNGGNGALLFNYNLFDDPIKVYNTYFRNSRVVIAGSKSLEFIIAFKDDTGLPNNQFSPVQNALPIIMQDTNGNHYDLTGLIISGPHVGHRLPSPKAYVATSFAWESFFGGSTTVFEE